MSVAFKERGNPAVLGTQNHVLSFLFESDVILAGIGYIPSKHHCPREFWLSVLDHRSCS